MTIAPPPEITTTDPSTEQWLPNGFPPPSFVVETERTSTFAGRGRWLAAAALLGVVLLIAGLLLIARSDPDRTALRTDATTTSTTTAEAAPVPSVSPTEGDPNATAPAIVDPTATAPPAAGATTTVAAPVPGAPPPPPPGVLEAPGGITLAPAFTNRPPVAGSLTLRNSGPTPLSFGSDVGQNTGFSVSPASGTIAPGATQPITVTFTPGNLPETEVGKAYVGRIVFNGSGGSRTVEVRTVVAKPPTIKPVGQGDKYVVSSRTNSTPCEGVAWLVRANVADTPAGVRNVTAFISSNGGPAEGTPMARKFGSDTAGIWELERPPATKEQGLRITRIVAVDNHRAEAEVRPDELVCPTTTT